MKSSTLAKKAMLVGLTIHGWQARKHDKKISKEVADKHAATNNAGRFNKHLLPGNADSYEAVHRKGRELREFYYENTLPWSKEGQRILPTANYAVFSEGVRRFKREYQLAVDVFITQYPLLKDEARALLNGMFNEQDYPNVEDMRKRFAIDLETLPMPTGVDFRADLMAEDVAEIQQQIENRIAVEMANANRDLWSRMRDAVENMARRLSNTEGRIHETLVTNLQDIINLIPRMNFLGDQNLQNIADECAKLTHVSPQALRDDQALRAVVAAQATEITNLMDAYM